ncbi:Uu.00g123860.m01.CDS01 [Anthostomella pinea]|uniref:Uu.00g123860.m01.CDS01 n=1 Tax=Anthostomella pinea TaxID=933095 RepID=A0AAI8VHH8_9PEZI|nr:Uu.00g123860.m01.CDS01 [Anthostomella pinea]
MKPSTALVLFASLATAFMGMSDSSDDESANEDLAKLMEKAESWAGVLYNEPEDKAVVKEADSMDEIGRVKISDGLKKEFQAAKANTKEHRARTSPADDARGLMPRSAGGASACDTSRYCANNPCPVGTCSVCDGDSKDCLWPG